MLFILLRIADVRSVPIQLAAVVASGMRGTSRLGTCKSRASARVPPSVGCGKMNSRVRRGAFLNTQEVVRARATRA